MMQGKLARKLRLLRAERGLTVKGAARSMGITRETLGLLEHGQRFPAAPTLQKIAETYGVEVEELFDLLEQDEEEQSLAEEPTLSGKAEAPPPPRPPVVKDTAAGARFKLTVEAKPEKWLTDILYDFADHVRQGTEDDDVLVHKAAHRILERVA